MQTQAYVSSRELKTKVDRFRQLNQLSYAQFPIIEIVIPTEYITFIL